MSDYDKGYRDGLAAFAHWKDGVQYVGTCGTTLHEALLTMANHEAYQPPKPSGLIAAAPDLLAAMKALTSNQHLNLGDLAYTIRDRELKGWDGPAVKAWSEAVQLAAAAIAKAEAQS